MTRTPYTLEELTALELLTELKPVPTRVIRFDRNGTSATERASLWRLFLANEAKIAHPQKVALVELAKKSGC